MIKIAQLFVILRAEQKTKTGRDSRFGERIEEMRTKFLVFDSKTPMDWMLTVRNFGRSLNSERTWDGNIVWSPDCKTITCKDFKFSISDFSKFASVTLLEKARGSLANLLLAKLLLLGDGETLKKDAPDPKLHALEDLPQESEAGWSFLKYHKNKHIFDTEEKNFVASRMVVRGFSTWASC